MRSLSPQSHTHLQLQIRNCDFIFALAGQSPFSAPTLSCWLSAASGYWHPSGSDAAAAHNLSLTHPTPPFRLITITHCVTPDLSHLSSTSHTQANTADRLVLLSHRITTLFDRPTICDILIGYKLAPSLISTLAGCTRTSPTCSLPNLPLPNLLQ